MDRRRIWQIGVVVDDLEAATAEMSSLLGLEFAPPIAHALGGNDIRVTLSQNGLPYFELIEGAAGGPWDGHTGSRLDHLSYFVEDIAAERERLVAQGCPVILDGQALGMPFNYHLLPSTNIRIEPVARAHGEWVRDRWGLGELNGGWDGAPAPWQLGFMVSDLDSARDELSRALGLEWTPTQSRGRDGALSVCMSLDGPPYFELVGAAIGSDFYWRPAPRFDHLAYWAEDLAAESARLATAGAPLVQVARPDEILFHHAPRSGLRLEVMAGAYRETVRSGWGFADVG